MHRTFLILHRWLALIVAVFLVVVALSGSVLVLEGPVSRARQMHISPTGSALPLDTLVQRARTKAGGGQVAGLLMGETPDVPWGVLVVAPRTGRSVIAFNQYTGAILPDPGPDALVDFIANVHQLHTRLLGGKTGQTIVVIVTWLALFLVVSGVIIWWKDKVWRVNTRASWKRVNFDLHHALGVFSAILLLLLTTTGLWVHYGAVDDWMHKLDRTPVTSPPKQPSAPAGTPAASLDSIAAAARRAVPGAAIMNIQLPGKAPAMVQLKYPEDHTPAGRSRVYVDKFRGTVLLAMSTRTAERGQHMIDIQRPLHTGDIYGLPTQILWALGALVLAFQAVTGVVMWWNAKRRLL